MKNIRFSSTTSSSRITPPPVNQKPRQTSKYNSDLTPLVPNLVQTSFSQASKKRKTQGFKSSKIL